MCDREVYERPLLGLVLGVVLRFFFFLFPRPQPCLRPVSLLLRVIPYSPLLVRDSDPQVASVNLDYAMIANTALLNPFTHANLDPISGRATCQEKRWVL